MQTTAPEELGVLGHHHADQQPTVRSADDAELVGPCDAARDEVGRDRREVVVGPLPVRLQRRLMPRRPILAAAAQVRHDVDSAPLDPRGAGDGIVLRGERDLEAAVAFDDGRVAAVEGEVFPGDLEVGNAGVPSLGCHEVLATSSPVASKNTGARFSTSLFRRVASASDAGAT